MPVSTIPAFGWENCARIANDHAELLVTLDVGPRILSYKLPAGENVLQPTADQMGTTGEKEFVARGGHRIWVSPETDLTYTPDNEAVTYETQEPNGLRVETPAGTSDVRKEMLISMSTGSSAVKILHRATNVGTAPLTIATWGLTVVAPNGVEIIPQPPLGKHGEEYLPNRIIVPWTYTDFSDDRWKFGRKYWTLTPKAGRPPTKLGFAHISKWAGYLLGSTLFLKTVDHDPSAQYPDFGCNYETFTQGDMIELETLSPLRTIEPGECVEHIETWHLFGGLQAIDPLDETSLDRGLQPALQQLGFL
ncbi:MAG: hypothetical protein ACO1QR_00580 [Chthoniobacteraceae bacterium]